MLLDWREVDPSQTWVGKDRRWQEMEKLADGEEEKSTPPPQQERERAGSVVAAAVS